MWVWEAGVLKASGRMCLPKQNVRCPTILSLPRPLFLLPTLQGSPVCCYESHSAPFFNLLLLPPRVKLSLLSRSVADKNGGPAPSAYPLLIAYQARLLQMIWANLK